MPTYRIQATRMAASTIPADAMVNTMHVNTGTPASESDFETIGTLVHTFFNAVNTAPIQRGIRHLLSSRSVGPSMTIKIYDEDDPLPRMPHFERVYSMIAAANEPQFPTEVAICLSWAGLPRSGWNVQSLRNRFYIGGLRDSIITETGHIPLVVQQQILMAAADLYNGLEAAGLGWGWIGYSPKKDQGWEIAGFSVDNAWDTQRRRGPDPTNRQIWVVGDEPPE